MEKKGQPRLGGGADFVFGPPDQGSNEKHHAKPEGPATKVAVASIQPNPYQPRKHFDEDELLTLAESIRIHGVLTPVLVRPVADGYQLIAGERRLRAAQLVGLTEIPAQVREMDEQQVLEAALVENIQRTDLNPIEKAAGFKDYLDKFKMTHENLAARIGLDRTTITNLLGLLNLPAEVQEYVRTGAISLGHAKVLKGLSDSTQQVTLSKEVIARRRPAHALGAASEEAQE